MNHLRSSGELGGNARVFLYVSISIIASAAFLGAAGALWGKMFLLKLHPYIFFTGFGNLAILILNRYLISAIYPELKIDPKKQVSYISLVLFSLVLVTAAVAMDWPFLKAVAGLLLLVTILGPLREIFTTVSVAGIWKDVSVRYYIFDVIFLLVANTGLFTLGLKESFPSLSAVIPFFVTQSSYFLGSSFPLSISVMGFLYTYAWKSSSKRELAKKLFSIWFYVFVGGVLVFLCVILIGHYLGMMLVSHLLLFGVMALLGSFTFYLTHFFRSRFKHPALAFLLSGLALLFATSGYGIMNIYFLKGIPFGTQPPLPYLRMWIYHSHTHAALLGWITFSFTGMIYIVLPSIVRSNSLETLGSDEALSSILAAKTLGNAFRQLAVMLVSATAVLLAFFLYNNILLAIAGFLFGCSVFYSIVNLQPELRGGG
ncbi:MAG: hypothetical protein HGA26_05390 [Chlorobiaceae bacterium]|nr:hypothetical protein [Chlorobiaceae bacterium]